MELQIQAHNAVCPICKLPFRPATNIVRFRCYHALHLECMDSLDRCPLCYELWTDHAGAARHDSDDEEAVSSRIEQMFARGVTLHEIKSQGLAVTLEALRDLGLRRSHFVRYPKQVDGESLARYPDITASKLLGYFGLTKADAQRLFAPEQLAGYGYSVKTR